MNFRFISWGSLLTIIFPFLFASVAYAKDPQTKYSKSTFAFNQLWELEKTFWDAFLYPANLKQTQGNESSIFDTNVG